MSRNYHQQNDWFTDDTELREIIDHKARRFRGRLDDDLGQRLALKVWEQSDRYDPTRGSPAAYVHTICDYAIRSEARHLATEKRQAEARNVSLEASQSHPNTQSDVEQSDLRIDIEAVLAELPDDERAICQDISSGIAECRIIENRNLTKHKFRRIKQRIRQVFRQRSLQDYWRQDKSTSSRSRSSSVACDDSADDARRETCRRQRSHRNDDGNWNDSYHNSKRKDMNTEWSETEIDDGGNELPNLARLINVAHERSEKAIATGLQHAVEAGRLLTEAKAKLAHGQWLPWIDENCSFSPRTAQRYIKMFEEFGGSNATHVSHLTFTDALKLVEQPKQPSAMMTSNSVEWYTPETIVTRVTDMFGTIDLDPCSNDSEKPNVPAATVYTKTDDGLSQPWNGCVYLNPPYGKTIGDWVQRLHDEYTAGNVTEAVALLPARTDTAWFEVLRDYPRCFVRGRLKFANSKNSAPFPSVLVYLGPNVEQFVTTFSIVGDVYQRVDCGSLDCTLDHGEGTTSITI